MSQQISNTHGSSLSGKTALVTGGTTGIGRAAAELFRAHGARVIVSGRDKESIERFRAEVPGISAVRSDVRSFEECSRLASVVRDELSSLDVVFLNAGIAKLAPFEAVDEAFYADHMDTNVKGVFFTLQQLLPLLGRGASVIVNSSAAAFKGSPNMSVYAATKGAVSSLVRTLAVELAPRGIRVNALSPAAIRTPIQDKFGLPPEVREQVERDFSTKIPLGRFGEATEVAGIALFLASEASSYITGADIPVDGGLLIA